MNQPINRLITTRDLFPQILRNKEDASQCQHMAVLSLHQVSVPRDPQNPTLPMLGAAQTLNYQPISLQCRNQELFSLLFPEAAPETVC